MNGALQETLAKLKPIKPPVEVPDTSLWQLLGLLALLALLAATALWLWRRKRRPRRRRIRKSPEQVARERLRAIDFGDTKGAVYTFGEYLPLLLFGDEEAAREFEALQRELEPYKYKKEVPPLPAELRKKMERLIAKGVKR